MIKSKIAMSPLDRLYLRILLSGLILVVLTAITIYIIYDSYTFENWPWIRASIILSVLTVFCVIVSAFGPAHEAFKYKIAGDSIFNHLHILFFAFLVLPLNVILVYPGLDVLGIESDDHLRMLAFFLSIIHSIGFAVCQMEIVVFVDTIREDSNLNNTSL